MLLSDLKIYSDYTVQEKAVVDYLLEYPESVLAMNCSELAQATYTSPANIVRLCKKFKFKGYQDFKLQYAKEYSLIQQNDWFLKSGTLGDVHSYDSISEIVANLYDLAIRNSQTYLNESDLRSAARKILNCSHLDIYGLGNRYHIGLNSAYKFQSVGINATAKNALDHNQLSGRFYKDNNVAVILSNSGKNETLLHYCKFLKQYGVFLISITSMNSLEIADLCDISLYADSGLQFKGLGNLMFQASAEYILDCLYVMAVSMDPSIKEQVSNNFSLFTIDDIAKNK